MKKKVSELIGVELDYAVAKCEGVNEETFSLFYTPTDSNDLDTHGYPEFHYSTVWAQGGPIIDREGLCVRKYCSNFEDVDLDNAWFASWFECSDTSADFINAVEGPTLLVAAMRCYVTSKLGNEVEVPEELI